MAHEAGVFLMALTDHDAVSGIDKAFAAAESLGVRLIPGIELSVEERGAHILGYGIDSRDPELILVVEDLRKGRAQAAQKTVQNLKKAGFTVDWEDVAREARGAVIVRPHIARAVLNRAENRERLGDIKTSHDFIGTYISNENPLYVSPAHISARAAIALIRKIGGVAVWSHPAIHFYRGSELNEEALESFLRSLIDWRIEGVEVLNASHTKRDAEFVESLARKYQLLRTAGSDFHEKGPHARDPKTGLRSAERPGDYPTYGLSTDDIVPRLEQAIESRRATVRND